jgi:hypothetical protein
MKKWTAFIVCIILVAVFIITMFVVPPLLGWTSPPYLSWQDFLDSISTMEGLIRGIVSQAIPVISVTIASIFLLIFVIKLIRGKE